MVKIIDISMEIKEGMIFYPGDPEIKIKKIPVTLFSVIYCLFPQTKQ